MIGKLLGRDEAYTALVLALSGHAMVAVARGGGLSRARTWWPGSCPTRLQG